MRARERLVIDTSALVFRLLPASLPARAARRAVAEDQLAVVEFADRKALC
jgi:hypothetical protein